MKLAMALILAQIAFTAVRRRRWRASTLRVQCASSIRFRPEAAAIRRAGFSLTR
jgi:hypothetical protein